MMVLRSKLFGVLVVEMEKKRYGCLQEISFHMFHISSVP